MPMNFDIKYEDIISSKIIDTYYSNKTKQIFLYTLNV